MRFGDTGALKLSAATIMESFFVSKRWTAYSMAASSARSLLIASRRIFSLTKLGVLVQVRVADNSVPLEAVDQTWAE
jgi:hypothetical protein